MHSCNIYFKNLRILFNILLIYKNYVEFLVNILQQKLSLLSARNVFKKLLFKQKGEDVYKMAEVLEKFLLRKFREMKKLTKNSKRV